MARPKKPEDPEKWPVSCGRCKCHYQIVVRWPDANICGYCYLRAKRTRGTCNCGHIGVLPGMIAGKSACRQCSGVSLNIDCKECGSEDELHSGGRCWNCVLARTVNDLLTNPESGVITEGLRPLARALKSMRRSNSGLTWIRQKHVSDFLRNLAQSGETGHDLLDGLPPSRTREFVRGLLVEHDALPHRDDHIVRYKAWSEAALTRISTAEHREVVTRYVRWHHLRRMHSMDEVKYGTFLRSKQTVTVTIDFLNWLADNGVALGDLQQDHLDAWQSEPNTTRELAIRFLQWAKKVKLVDQTLEMTPHRRGTGLRMDAEDQLEAVEKVTRTTDLTDRDRCAAILVLVFAQPIERVVNLTWDDVIVSDEMVTIQVGSVAIALPEPLDEPWRAHCMNPGHDKTAAHPRSHWVFRGIKPGQHIDAGALRQRLRSAFSTSAARMGTLHELTKLAPVAILADTLGYATSTVERHAVASNAQYACPSTSVAVSSKVHCSSPASAIRVTRTMAGRSTSRTAVQRSGPVYRRARISSGAWEHRRATKN